MTDATPARKRRAPPHAMHADIVALLVRKTRTAPELVNVAGYARTAVDHFLHALMAEGLVTRARPAWSGRGGGTCYVYTWVGHARQPVP